MYKKDLVYGSVQGAGLIADIASPDEKTDRLPVILSVHGGRWVRGDRWDTTTIDLQQWSDFGFFAMSIEYRLVTSYPAPACYQDMYCAIRWIHAHADEYHLDIDRIFLIGMSAGGHMVALASTLGEGSWPRTGGWEDQSCDFRAAISVSGAYNLVALDWGSGWMPTGEDWIEARKYASPVQHVTNQSKPMLILHSDDDPSIPIEQVVSMSEALEAAGSTYTFRHYTDRGHMPITDKVVEESRCFIEMQCEQSVSSK